MPTRSHFFRLMGPRPILLNINADVASYNVFTAAGSPGSAVVVVVRIASGVWCGPMTCTGFAAGSRITIINQGTLAGMGGKGGDAAGAGSGPVAGSDALTLGSNDVTIDNTSGNIWGGGGGGGQGADQSDLFLNSLGGGGGGGAGYTGGAAGQARVSGGWLGVNGNAGSRTGPGGGGAGGQNQNRAGAGGPGGGFGAKGDWSDPSVPGNVSIDGGAAGKAVALNGRTVTWLGGFNGTQIRGAVA